MIDAIRATLPALYRHKELSMMPLVLRCTLITLFMSIISTSNAMQEDDALREHHYQQLVTLMTTNQQAAFIGYWLFHSDELYECTMFGSVKLLHHYPQQLLQEPADLRSSTGERLLRQATNRNETFIAFINFLAPRLQKFKFNSIIIPTFVVACKQRKWQHALTLFPNIIFIQAKEGIQHCFLTELECNHLGALLAGDEAMQTVTAAALAAFDEQAEEE
ncbi:hypothetical protein M1466_03695 [Candidatus Dependentiae bacterium]|nr:hypothetical protein [Candidatus Dependentiae bacterium]